MALILAIEPDRKQSSKVAALAKNKLDAELIAADTTEHAIAALGGRVPDLILTSLLLSPKDESALADWLRDLDDAGSHVQTLVIPVLGHGSGGSKREGGIFGRFTGGRSKDDSSPDGCDPTVFATQIREYLDRLAEERRAAQEELDELEAASKPAATEPPAVEPVPDEPPDPDVGRVLWTSHTPQPVYEDPQPEEIVVAADDPIEDLPDIEIEAVVESSDDVMLMEAAAGPAADGTAALEEAESDEDPWSEITLGGDDAPEPVVERQVEAAEDSEDVSVELTSEQIDLQRFVEELAAEASQRDDRERERKKKNGGLPWRAPNPVLAEFVEALEVMTADEDEGDAAKAAPASGVAAAEADLLPERTAAPPRDRPKKKKKALPRQNEWGLFDPEQCGFSALLAKLEELDNQKPQKRRR